MLMCVFFHCLRLVFYCLSLCFRLFKATLTLSSSCFTLLLHLSRWRRDFQTGLHPRTSRTYDPGLARVIKRLNKPSVQKQMERWKKRKHAAPKTMKSKTSCRLEKHRKPRHGSRNQGQTQKEAADREATWSHGTEAEVEDRRKPKAGKPRHRGRSRGQNHQLLKLS